MYKFLLRMPEELREKLVDAAQASGRSLNKEIVARLEGSLDESTTRGEALKGRRIPQRRLVAVLAATAIVLVAALAGVATQGRSHHAASLLAKLQSGDQHFNSQGQANGNGDESAQLIKGQQQFDDQRLAPNGILDPGGYSAAFGTLTGLKAAGGSWQEVTKLPYDADDPNYRDYYSNSSGGAGLVTGRITGIAADGNGDVYAGGANGGVWRSTTGGGNWVPIADQLPSLSTGDLELDPQTGWLWYGTGEANTGATSYVGAGVYVDQNPSKSSFSPTAGHVGGTELESTTIGKLRFAGDRVWAATSRGIWWHSRTSTSGVWNLAFAPNPSYMPGGADSSSGATYLQNIVNDIAIDPTDATHLVAAVGWRGGASYNGFYESHDNGATWAKINPTGAINPNDIGYATFAYSADGSKLYVINESVQRYNQLTGTAAYNSLLDGIYVSNTGNPAGPWNKIADSTKLANSGSALKQAVGGKGYGPGVQAWYNQSLIVDPTNANHVVAGLEELYDTANAGSTWNTVGPYWNFYFPCWSTTALYPPDGQGACPLTPHSDQHALAVGTYKGTLYLYAGNDGGIYRRPLEGAIGADGHGTDWTSLNDGSIDALQYYSASAGLVNNAKSSDLYPGSGNVVVSGGLQDNGGSLVRLGSSKMSSNFGGDGGDTLVDPNDGCNIAQEYVDLSMYVTNDCARSTDPQQFVDLSKSTTWSIAPPDVNARFIAPFTADAKNVNNWLAGGNSVWFQSKGFAIRSGSEWQKVETWPSATQVTTALGYAANTAIAAWCGPCNAEGSFARGAAVGTLSNGQWSWHDIAFSADFPNRYISGAAVDPANPKHMLLAVSGFSRRFAEGPGTTYGHVFESTNGGTTWTSIDGSTFPDEPADSVLILPSGGIVVGTDLGVVYRAKGSTTWQRLGGSTLPVTVDMTVRLGPDGNIYVATHGRGIWRISAAGL